MKYHVDFSLPDTSIYEGPGEDSRSTFDTFEEARDAAIRDLEHWRDKIDANLEELRRARSIRDLSYHQGPDAASGQA